jgi:hypothetical protein
VTRLERRGLGHRWRSSGSGQSGESVDKSSETFANVSRARATKHLKMFHAQKQWNVWERFARKSIETSKNISRANASIGFAVDFAYFVDRPNFIL